MLIPYLILSISLLTVLINAQNISDANKFHQTVLNIAMAEHKQNLVAGNDSNDQSWQTTTEKTLIRVTRLPPVTEKLQQTNQRERRQIIETIQTAGVILSVAKAMQKTESGEQILGMAKKVAIAVIVLSSLCATCLLITTVVICVKCCCGKKNSKRNQGPTTIQVPHPIFVQTGPTGYQPQYYPQQAPQSWNPGMVPPPESRPMLPQPSAPPHSNDYFHSEHPPPPYEKLYTGKQ